MHYNGLMFSIVIQAGGESTRMGEDKALLPFLGQPLIKRIYHSFQDLGDELLVITNQPEGYQFLPVPLIQDLIPGRGALGGLYTALQAASHPLIGLVACDLPFASPEPLDHCRQVLEATGADGVIPSDEGGIQPLHAVYRVKTCLPLVHKAIVQDKWRMISWHAQAQIKILSPQRTRKVSGSPHTFQNVNTPEDFRKAQRRARQTDSRGDHTSA